MTDKINSRPDLAEVYASTMRKKMEIASNLLEPTEIEQLKQFRSLSITDLDNFNVFDLLPEPNDLGSKKLKFLNGYKKSTSEMGPDEFKKTFDEAKTHPWDIYSISKISNGDQIFSALSTFLECARLGTDSGNNLHFTPFNQESNEDLKRVLPPEATMVHPMFMWVKGTQLMISAIENGHLELTKPHKITTSTNQVHATFLKHWGFQQTSYDTLSIDYEILKINFKNMTENDSTTKRIIESGELLYKNALLKVPTFIERYSKSKGIHSFWDWFYKNR